MLAGGPPVTSPMGAAGNSRFVNAANFAANARIQSPGLAMPPIPPPPFSQELFKQLVNSSLPPPPPPSYPPVPIPKLSFSPYQPPPILPPNFAPPHVYNPPNPAINTGNSSQKPEEPQAVFENPPEITVGSREEGELSDGELEDESAADNSQIVSQGEAAKGQLFPDTTGYSSLETQGRSGTIVHHTSLPDSSRPYPSRVLTQTADLLVRSSPQQYQKARLAVQAASTFTPGVDSPSQNQPRYENDMGNVFQKPRKIVPQISPPSREDSGSCISPNRSHFTPNANPLAAYDPPSVMTPDFALDHSDDRDGTVPQVHRKSPSQMRELAKGALLSLAPHGIRYPELVREGVNPDLLQQLYEEVGIKDSRPEMPEVVRTSQAVDLPQQKPVSITTKPDKHTPLTVLPDKPASGPRSIKVAVDVKDPPRNQRSSSQSTPDSMGPTKSMETPFQLIEQASHVSTKSLLATAVSNVALERKDRIAQLLAAKTGKPAPVRSIPEAALATAQVHLSPVPVPKATAAETSAQTATAPEEPNQPLLKSVKNKAQTDLVRQKLESLKREAEAKAQAQRRLEASVPPKISMPASNTNMALDTIIDEQSPPTILKQDIITHPDGSLWHTRSARSDFQSLTKPSSQPDYAYRIPGLFMMSDEAAHAEEQVSKAAGSQADKLTHISSDLENSPTQRSRTSSEQDHYSTSGSLTEYNLGSLSNQGFSSQLQQKRPLASDSFDEPLPPAKRPVGRKESVEHIEIDVSIDVSGEESGEEIDDGSDGIGMDIDDDSQASALFVDHSTPSKEALEQDIQASLPTTTLPERPPVQLQRKTSGVNNPTPSKEKEKDQEDPWRVKNLRIEELRRKIAEAEQRQKAKKSQSQAQSPHSSLPGTPAAPKLQIAALTQSSNAPSIMHNNGIKQDQPLGHGHAVVQQANYDDRKSSSVNLVSRGATESPSQNEDMRKKMARRKELQEGLPNLDAEVQATQLKLAQTKARLAVIKREAERREAEIREARQREAEILAEAIKLEEQLNTGLRGRSRFSEELQSLGADLQAVSEVHTTATELSERDDTASNLNHVPPTTNLPEFLESQAITDVAQAATSGTTADADNKGSAVNESFYEIENGAAKEEGAVASGLSSAQFVNEAGKDASTATSQIDMGSHSKTDEKLRSQPQIPGDPESYEASTTHPRSDEESVGIDNLVEVSFEDPNGLPGDLDNDNDGSVSMSDSGTDDYDPAEIPDVNQYPDMESDGYEPDDGFPTGNSFPEEPSDNDDDYEPAEEIEPMEVDLRTMHPVSMNNEQQAEDRGLDPVDQGSSGPYSPEPVDKQAIDDIEDGLELSEANTLNKPQDLTPPPQLDMGASINDVGRSSTYMYPSLILTGVTRGSSGHDAFLCL